jgi:DNA-directed RNA polymerase specialized sigma24 family protein
LGGESGGRHPDKDQPADWGDIYKRLVLWCIKRHRLPPEDAKQVAQEAICRAHDSSYADWDRTKYPTLLNWLGSIVNGIVVDLRRSSSHRNERLVAADIAATAVSLAPSAERRVAEAETLGKAVSRLLDLTQGDDIAQRIILLMADGVDSAADQARALSVDRKVVYRKRERLAELVDQVAQELEIS